MIKFFRKIRRKLIDEGSLKSYIIYAIGEIILVVIGILIAVQLNNWNQERIRNAELEVLLDKVEEDLIHNINKTNDAIEVYHVNDSLTRKVINDEVTIENYYNDERLGNLLFRHRLLKLNTENINKLIEKEELISSKYETIIEIAKELIRSIIYNEYTEEPLKSIYYGNIDFLMSQPFWIAKSDSSSIKKRYEFFASDENYKKRVLNYWAKTSEMALTTMYHRSASMELLGRIKVIRHHYDAGRLHQLFKSLNLNSFRQISCGDEVTRNKNQFYRNERFLISNMSEKQAYLFLRNSKGDIVGELEINPGGYAIFMETWLEFAAIDDDYFSVIELYQDGQCIKKYVEERNGYLIVE
jgi:hypothetical protein